MTITLPDTTIRASARTGSMALQAGVLCLAVLIAGANANNGANVGRFYGNWNNTASNGNWNISALHLFLAHRHGRAQSAMEPCHSAKIEPQGTRPSRAQKRSRTGAQAKEGFPMPKRASHLWERAVTDENCIAAVHDMLKGKRGRATYAGLYTRTPKESRTVLYRRMAKHVHVDRVAYYRANPDEIGRKVAAELRDGTWGPHPYREKLIYDGIRGKVRCIRVPCLHDQIVHHALMRVTAPEILRRNDPHNCGSIPGAGQSRAVDMLRRWMGSDKSPKYALITDVRKFYDSCPHDSVMAALRSIIKDGRLLTLHEQVLASMGTGLAIGFYASQWYANLVLAAVDHIANNAAGVRWVRYMDDMVAVSSNKRALHRLRKAIDAALHSLGLSMKRTWQVFRIASRGIPFLSYRFFAGHTLLRKGLMIRMTRTMRNAAGRLTPHAAMAVMSYMGILKRCNSYRFRMERVYPYIDIQKCKEVIRYVTALCRVRRTTAAS
jgi:RNA-directed DNA polymerase